METEDREQTKEKPIKQGSSSIRKVAFQWPNEIRAQALGMYLVQENPDLDAISKALGPPVATLRYWQNKDGWVAKREAAFSAMLVDNYDSAMAEINSRRRRTLDDMDKVRDDAMDALVDPDLYFKDKKQVADVIRDIHKAERDIYNTEEPKILLAEIGRIVLGIVSDEDERRSIGRALLELQKEWSKR